MADTAEWLDPWYPVSETDVRAGLEEQLHREVSKRHVLFGESARLIARRTDTDDALFVLSNGRIAEVHLTWSKRTEPDPRWPATAVFSSIEEWRRDSMVPLHEELAKLWNRPGNP
jgi:hypothetical protein